MTADRAQQLAEGVVQGMLAQDAFSRWLGVAVLETAPGRSVVRMTIRPEMVNGFGVSHGGIVYSLADSALAFAANTNGNVTVAIENSMGYPQPVHVGDVVTAVCDEESVGNRVGYYRVTCRNQLDVVVATFRGTVYRTSTVHTDLSSRA